MLEQPLCLAMSTLGLHFLSSYRSFSKQLEKLYRESVRRSEGVLKKVCFRWERAIFGVGVMIGIQEFL